MSKPLIHKVYEFSEFRLDADHRMLYQRGEELPLPPKAVETLLALIERRGEIVSKDELIQRIWPDSFVEESNLFLYLSVLRKTLGTQQNGEPWLETLRRRGYRFNGEVRATEYTPVVENGGSAFDPLSEPDTQRPTDDQAEVPREPKVEPWTSRRVLLTVAAVMAVVAILAFTYPYLGKRAKVSSIAVMPFVNGSGDVELEYLSDGMTDSLIGSLRSIPELQVKASSTMFRYKGKNVDAATVGKELDVQAVLSSRMVQRGEDITLYVELVDSQTENSLWQQIYTRKISQFGVLQRDVARDLVRELSFKVTDPTKQRLAKNYTENAEATRLYYQGLFLIRKLREKEIRQGLVYLRQAVGRDPTYAPAYAMIAAGHRSLALCCDVHPSEMVEGKAAASRAVELDENLAEAHTALATTLYSYDWNFAEAEKHYLRALELDPNNATAHFSYGDFLGRMGRQDEAKAERKLAAELEPFSPFFNAFALDSDDQDTELERARFTIGLDPNFYFSHFAAAGTYRRLKMFPEAIAEYRRAKELAPEQTWTDISYIGLLNETGQVDEARAVQEELLHSSESRFVPPYHIAIVYNQRGDTEQALAWLEKAYQMRDPKMTFLKTARGFKKLEADPRFKEIYQRVFGS